MERIPLKGVTKSVVVRAMKPPDTSRVFTEWVRLEVDEYAKAELGKLLKELT